MRLFDPYFATRRRLKVALAAAGFIAGAIFGVALTILGKIVAGAPPATLANYEWNAAVFGIMAAFVSPVVTWSNLRRAPLWRTVVEPLALAIAGGAVGVLAGSGILMVALAPAGLMLGFVHLGRKHPQEPGEDPALASRTPMLPAKRRGS